MWIRSIELQNFRGYGDSRQTLKARRGLNVIVGENNSGKSSIFAAVEHLLALRSVPETDVTWGSTAAHTEIAIDIVWEDFGPTVRQGILGNFTLEDDPWMSREIDRVFGKNVQFYWSRNTSHQARFGKLDTGVQKNEPETPFAKLTNSISRSTTLDQALSNHPSSINFGSNIQHVIAEQVRNRVRMFSDVRVRPAMIEASNTSESWDGRGIAALLLALKNGDVNMRRKFGRIQEKFSNLFPGLTFEVKLIDGRQCRIVMSRKGFDFDIPAEQIGTGVLEVLTIITNLQERERSILVVEEPGTHLHPQAQKALQRVIVESAKSNQVFVLTHSPEFVNWADLDGLSRIWMKGVESQISRIDEETLKDNDKAVLVESLRDPRRREVLFARGVGLVEGDTEEAYFEALAPRMGIDLDALGISVIAVGGESCYRPYLRYLKALSIPTFCQRDKAPTGITDEFKPLFLFTDSEFEDYLKECNLESLLETAAKAVGRGSKARIGRYCGEQIDLTKVPEKHREFLDKLATLVKSGS